MNELIYGSKVVPLVTIAAGAAGTSAINSSTIDFQDCEGALIIIQTGAITTGAVTSFKFQEGATTTPATDVLGTNQAIADDDDNEVFYLDIRRPSLRYGRIAISRATQAAAVSAVAVLYGFRDKPTTQAAGVTGEVFCSPAAGTA